MRSSLVAVVALTFLACGSSQSAAEPTWAKASTPAHWSYVGEDGAARWGSLGYRACDGQAQSPIDLPAFDDQTASAPLELDVRATPLALTNNGHTLMQRFAPGSGMSLDGARFELEQLHVHVPGEHKVAGAPTAMEFHLVHHGPNGRLAVVAILAREGGAHPLLEALWSMAPEDTGAVAAMDGFNVDAGELLPADLTYYRYEGSLTTPPCTEGVTWIVLSTPIEIAPAQAEVVRALFGPNARPVQDIHGRSVGLLGP